MRISTHHLNGRSTVVRRPASLPAPARSLVESRMGYGEVHAHHGEILQGVFYTNDGRLEHGLVTLPCNLYRTRVRFRAVRSGPLVITPAGRSKAKLAARLMLDALGCTGWGGVASIDTNVPLSWGCGSSTTDVLGVIRAVADAFGTSLQPQWLARLAVAAETASDPLMYEPDDSLLFAQRTGSRLISFGGPLPSVYVLGFNTDLDGGGVDTLTLPICNYSGWEVEAFRPLVGMLRHAIERNDPELLGRVATASAEINQRHRPKPLMAELRRIAKRSDALGIQVAHSGTVAGLLFEVNSNVEEYVHYARTMLRGIGLSRTWLFSTEFSLRLESEL